MTKKISIAVLFKATRKYHRLQQTEFATILGVTQGTISKIESNMMSPDLSIWFNFLKAFNIQDPYCFTYNALEMSKPSFADLRTKGSALAPKFDFQKGDYIFTIKKLRPLFDMLMKNHTMSFEMFLKDSQISKELFYILNHPVTSDFADNFFSFLHDNKLNDKTMSLMDLNFKNSLGRIQKDLDSINSPQDLFSIINNDADSIINYESSGTNGEYFINLKQKDFQYIKDTENLDLIINYNLLYPFHILKSTKNLTAVTPQINELKKGQRWQVTYAS